MLTIACRDVGQPCDCVLSRETEEELLKKSCRTCCQGSRL